MEFTLDVKAPGLEQAINNLAQAISGQLPVNTQQEQQATSPQQQAPQQAPWTQQQTQQQQQQQQPPQGAVPTSNPEYSQDQLAVAATQLMDAGKQQELVNLLQSFNVQALTQMPKEQYGTFATKLRELGAKI